MRRVFRRRLKKKTDYKNRLAMLKSDRPRLVIRRFLSNIRVQIVVFDGTQDKTIIDISSSHLEKFGWKVHGGNVPSSYLVGFLAGIKAKKTGIGEANADIGLHTSVKNSSIYAAVKGAKDAGLGVNMNKDFVPDDNRISGKHISDFAVYLEKNDIDKYKKQFGNYFKKGIDPKQIQKYFEDVKGKIKDQ